MQTFYSSEIILSPLQSGNPFVPEFKIPKYPIDIALRKYNFAPGWFMQLATNPAVAIGV